MKKDIIAIIGMGKGGKAILETILQIPEIHVKAVYDINPKAPGFKLAKAHNIPTIAIQRICEISDDPEIEFIFEVTGKHEVYEQIKLCCKHHCTIIGSATTKIIFHLLEAQQQTNAKVEACKNGLELAIIQRTKELEETNKQLQIKIIDYQRLNDKLQRINDEKTRYLLQATHQLKAPFAAIQSYTDIILGGFTGLIPEKTQDIVKKIKLRCVLLSHSIREMLELANLKSVVHENIQMQVQDVNSLIQESINEVQVIALQKQISIHFNRQEGVCDIMCNAQQMKILFTILLENAINYSTNQTNIEVTTQTDKNNQLLISFKDRGIGIAKKHHKKIFQEYFRTNESVVQHADGTGLGLSIAKQIVDLHGFSIEVFSEPNKGASFVIHIFSD